MAATLENNGTRKNMQVKWKSSITMGSDGANREISPQRRGSRPDMNRVSVSEYLFRPEGLEETSPQVEWLRSFAKSDPRWKIMRYFQNVVLKHELQQNGALLLFSATALKGDIGKQRPAAFSVWRPTSMDAIQMMMTGKGTGKGLDIKGKSAKRGSLSGYVPFVQIHNSLEDKNKVGTSPQDARLRVFYRDEMQREKAINKLQSILLQMNRDIRMADYVVTNGGTEEEYEKALQKMTLKMSDARIIKINDYAPKVWGLDLPERLFWETYIIQGECIREEGSDLDTGRPSEPQFFYMNLTATRKGAENVENKIRPVVWQHSTKDPLDPMTLLTAYEECGTVLPVVSDFDPFLVGTRGVAYKEPMDPEQIKILKWCLESIEGIIKDRDHPKSWTSVWLDVLKTAAKKNFHPEIPQYGFGDPTSYSIIESAVGNLQANGAVRHGAECFNYYFPQQLDEQFLVICPTEQTGSPYRYLNKDQLKNFLLHQVRLGFTFPLNIKWVLCDPGWLEIWYALHASNHKNVQESLDIWYPPESGIREEVTRISETYPKGFVLNASCSADESESTEGMDLAMLELKRHLTLERAKKKLRIALLWLRIASPAQRRASGIYRVSTMSSTKMEKSDLEALKEEFNDISDDENDTPANKDENKENVNSSEATTKTKNFRNLSDEEMAVYRKLSEKMVTEEKDQSKDSTNRNDTAAEGKSKRFKSLTEGEMAFYQRMSKLNLKEKENKTVSNKDLNKKPGRRDSRFKNLTKEEMAVYKKFSRLNLKTDESQSDEEDDEKNSRDQLANGLDLSISQIAENPEGDEEGLSKNDSEDNGTEKEEILRKSDNKEKFLHQREMMLNQLNESINNRLQKVKEQETEIEKLKQIESRGKSFIEREAQLENKEKILETLTEELIDKLKALEEGKSEFIQANLTSLVTKEMELRRKEISLDQKDKDLIFKEKRLDERESEMNTRERNLKANSTGQKKRREKPEAMASLKHASQSDHLFHHSQSDTLVTTRKSSFFSRSTKRIRKKIVPKFMKKKKKGPNAAADSGIVGSTFGFDDVAVDDDLRKKFGRKSNSLDYMDEDDKIST